MMMVTVVFDDDDGAFHNRENVYNGKCKNGRKEMHSWWIIDDVTLCPRSENDEGDHVMVMVMVMVIVMVIMSWCITNQKTLNNLGECDLKNSVQLVIDMLMNA